MNSVSTYINISVATVRRSFILAYIVLDIQHLTLRYQNQFVLFLFIACDDQTDKLAYIHDTSIMTKNSPDYRNRFSGLQSLTQLHTRAHVCAVNVELT